MANFVLDTSTLAGDPDQIAYQRLEGFGRWWQFKVRFTSSRAFTFLGYVLSVVTAGERRTR